jgi:hypothetical protein
MVDWAMKSSTKVTRRRLLVGAGTVLALAGGRASPVVAGLAATPRQTTGPFYPVELPLDRDNDLVRFAGASAPAQGQITHVFGRVLDRDVSRSGNAMRLGVTGIRAIHAMRPSIRGSRVTAKP